MKSFKNITKGISMICAVALLSISFSISVNAAELVSGARWCHMSSTSSGIIRCDLKISVSHLKGGWNNSSVYNTAINNWNYYSGGKVSITSCDFSESNVDLLTYSGEWIYNSDLVAFTTITDKYGHTYSGGIRSDDAPISSFGNRIRYAGVIFNPNFDNGGGGSNATMNLRKTMTHEIGHCINLGHPSTSETSVMKPGWNLSWTNYDMLQSFDRTTLSTMYNTIYS